MKIGLITTLGTNIGDDFIREGIVRVIRTGICPDARFVSVNKHKPFSVYPGWHPARYSEAARKLPRGAARAQRLLRSVGARFGGSFFHDADLVVQCGAPVLWPGCHRAEWAGPIWDDVVGSLYGQVPVLNLAAGSCYPWRKQPARLDDEADAAYLHRIFSYCRVTTVRDPLALELWRSLGDEARLLPCTASLAPGIESGPRGSFVFVNYMPGGGHYDWGQQISGGRWEATVAALAARLQKRHKVVFVCHNDRELEEASRLVGRGMCAMPRTVGEYFELASQATAGLCNRMHASVALAGMGIPSIAVGTDTRMLMVDRFGLPTRYVEDADVDEVEACLEGLIRERQSERARLLELRRQTVASYIEVFKTVVG